MIPVPADFLHMLTNLSLFLRFSKLASRRSELSYFEKEKCRVVVWYGGGKGVLVCCALTLLGESLLPDSAYIFVIVRVLIWKWFKSSDNYSFLGVWISFLTKILVFGTKNRFDEADRTSLSILLYDNGDKRFEQISDNWGGAYRLV